MTGSVRRRPYDVYSLRTSECGSVCVVAHAFSGRRSWILDGHFVPFSSLDASEWPNLMPLQTSEILSPSFRQFLDFRQFFYFLWPVCENQIRLVHAQHVTSRKEARLWKRPTWHWSRHPRYFLIFAEILQDSQARPGFLQHQWTFLCDEDFLRSVESLCFVSSASGGLVRSSLICTDPN